MGRPGIYGKAMEPQGNTIKGGVRTQLDAAFLDVLLGRRSRRVFLGAEIPDGVFQYKSRHRALPLSDLEKQLILLACGGNTGWNNLIYRAERYAPHLSNYAAAAGGRTFPSAAGFETSQLFFTDDEGVYLLDNRDAPACGSPGPDGIVDLDQALAALSRQIRKIQEGRLQLPSQTPYVEPHNTWVVNKPATFLVIPVGDLSQHVLLNLCYMLQNGLVLYDDITQRPVPGIEQFQRWVDTTRTWPLTFVDQWSLAELTAELASSTYAGTLMLQALGLGGWAFNGIDPFSMLGASGDPACPGLGFQYQTRENWPYPNPVGLPKIMEGYCPPFHTDMHDAVKALCERKFGPGGPFHPATPGPWRNSSRVRSAAQVHDAAFRDCVALQAQYLLETFGKFPATVPTMFVIMYLQAGHLDLDFYDTFYQSGAYLQTHADHIKTWHSGKK